MKFGVATVKVIFKEKLKIKKMSSHIKKNKNEFTKTDFKKSVNELLEDFRENKKIKSFIIPGKRPSFCPEVNDKSEKTILETIKSLGPQFDEDYKIVEEYREQKRNKKRKNIEPEDKKHRKTGFSSPTYVERSLCDLINENVDDAKLRIQIKKTSEGELGVANRDLVNSFISWYVRKNKLNMEHPRILFKLDKSLMKIFESRIPYLKEKIDEKNGERGYVSDKCAKLEVINGEHWINYASLQIIITPLFHSKYHIPNSENYYVQIDALRELFKKDKTKLPKQEKKSDVKDKKEVKKPESEEDSDEEY